MKRDTKERKRLDISRRLSAETRYVLARVAFENPAFQQVLNTAEYKILREIESRFQDPMVGNEIIRIARRGVRGT